jgi:Tol biopolymer transport system component
VNARLRLSAWCSALLVAVAGVVSLTCGGTPTDDGTGLLGSIRVNATTTGQDPDADGYAVVLDSTQTQTQTLAVNGQVVFSDVAPGTHSVDLTGVAANCTVSGSASRSVLVGTSESVVSFSVTCSQILGAIQLTAATTGPDLDADGYVVRVDGAAAATVGVSETITIPNLTAGDHAVELGDLQVNCAVGGANPRTVTVVKGTSVPTTFDVSCARALLDQIVFIVYDTTRNPKVYQMYAMNVDGANVRNLSNSTNVLDFGADVSPDGTRLVLWRGDLGATQWDVYLMNPDGAILQNLTNDATVQSCTPAWSPDGSQIAFCEGALNGSAEIWTMSPDGTNRVRRTNNTNDDINPAWHPGGGIIAYQKNRGSGWGYDLWTVNLGTGVEAALAASANAFDGTPSFAPSGTAVVYASDRTGNMEIFWKPMDGSAETNLTNNAANDATPSISPDGTRIAFASNRAGYSAIWVMNADGTGATQLTTLRLGVTLLPRWSPPHDH